MKTKPRKQQGRRQGRSYLARKHKEQARVVEPLTPKTLRKETRAATNQRFRPLEKAIGGDLRASERRVKETGNWWQNYLNTVNAGQADTAAAYAQAAQTGQAQIGQASAIDTANTAGLQADAAKSAELRGAAPTTAPAEREAAMQAQRNYLAAAQGGALQAAGANQRGYLNEQKRIGVGQSIASRKEEQRRGQSIRKDRRDTRTERGDYAATKRGELRKEERDYLTQRKAFGFEKGKFGAEQAENQREAGRDARESAADRAIAKQNANSSTRSSRASQTSSEASAKNAQTAAEKEETSGGLTPTQRRTRKESHQSATAAVWRTIKANGVPKNQQEWAGMEAIVAKEDGVNASQAREAVKRIKAKLARKDAKKQEEIAHHPYGY